MPLDLSSDKPENGTSGDASQIANGFTAIENYVNGNFEPAGIKQTGAQTAQALVWDGTKWAPGWAARVFQFAPLTIVSSSTLTSLFSQSIPGGTLGSTKALRVTVFGDWFNNAGGAKTYRFQILWGGSAIIDLTTSALPTNGTQRGAVRLEFDLAAVTDSGHQYAEGSLRFASQGAATTGIGNTDLWAGRFATGATVAVDSTANKTLEVKAQLQSLSASLDLRMQHARIEVIG